MRGKDTNDLHAAPYLVGIKERLLAYVVVKTSSGMAEPGNAIGMFLSKAAKIVTLLIN